MEQYNFYDSVTKDLIETKFFETIEQAVDYARLNDYIMSNMW